MRQLKLPIFALIATSVALLSCGDIESPVQAVDVPKPSADTLPTVETLPIDDIADQIVEMPDGIHLRPGVDIWEMAEPVHPFIVMDPNSTQVEVLAPAWEAFEPVGPGDAVFVNGMGFIVETIDKQDARWIYEVSEIDLSRLVWGNFRIPWEFSTAPMAQSPDDIVTEDVPQFDEFGNIVRYAALDIVNTRYNRRGEFKLNNDVKGTYTVDATFRMPATMKGAFEGRIGTFNSSYRCLNPDDGRFCVDRIAAWAETTFSATASVEAKVSREFPFLEKKLAEGSARLGSFPLGSTGLRVSLELFDELKVEGKATGEAEGTLEYQFSKTVPFGFEYMNKPRQNLVGVFAIPNARVPLSGPGGRFTKKEFKLAATLELEAGYSVGLKFGIETVGGVAKLRGAKIAAIEKAKFTYRPLQTSAAPDACAEATLQLYGKASAKLEFEVDLRLWTWSRSFQCSGDDCAEVSTPKFDLIPKQKWEGFCLDSNSFDTLLIEPRDGSPLGYQDVAGYDVDSVCLTRSIAPNPRAGIRGSTQTYCATTGPAALRGRPDGVCPMTTAKVAGLTGPTEVKFPVSILPGDVITLVQSNTPGACNGSGAAKLTLKRGSRTRPLGGGVYFERNVSVKYE